jgi:hypothetical protein
MFNSRTMFIAISAIGILAGSALAEPSAEAQATPAMTQSTDSSAQGQEVNWYPAIGLDTGEESSVYVRGRRMVEVHRSESNWSDDFWYRIGVCNTFNGAVAWGPSHDLSIGGSWPTVAITREGYVILIYADSVSKASSHLNYWIGKMDLGGNYLQTIDWVRKVYWYDGGFHPHVTLTSDGKIVEVHESGNGNNGIFYRVGHLKDPTAGEYDIVWDSGQEHGVQYDDGINPSIAIDRSNNVVEVHQAKGDNYLHYSRGTLSGAQISFTTHPRFDNNGEQPAVTMTEDGKALEVQSTSRAIYYRVGTLSTSSNDKVDWTAPTRIDPSDTSAGLYPSIGYDEGLAVTTWQTGKNIRYSTALLF